MPPTTGQPVWVLDALPLDRLPTDSAETQAHTGLSRWCKTSVYSDFFPRCPGPSGCVLLSGHGGAPQHQEVWGEQGTEVTPSGVGRCPSTRKEGPLATVRAAGTPEGQGALVCIRGARGARYVEPGPQGTHSSTRHILLPGPLLVALSRAVRATHHNHVGVWSGLPPPEEL